MRVLLLIFVVYLIYFVAQYVWCKEHEKKGIIREVEQILIQSSGLNSTTKDICYLKG